MAETPTHRMDGKTCLVTGASSGIGKATAFGLARLGATVVMAARNEKRGEKARGDVIRRSGNDDVHLVAADLARRREVFDLAATVRARFPGLSILVNNAGVLRRTRRLTPDGVEIQFAVNHLAYFLLANLLADTLIANAPARIVNIASTAHSRGVLDWDDLQCERHYDGWQQYANTKLANIAFTYELARRLDGSGVTANCVHPGVIYTGLMRGYSRPVQWLWNVFQPFFKKPEEGADTPVYLASSPEVEGVTGRYFKYRHPLDSSESSRDTDVQRRLWEASESITGYASPLRRPSPYPARKE